MKTELDILRDVSQRLEAGGIEFMLTGSMAMNFYAQPRMTRDLDLVVELRAGQIDLLISLFDLTITWIAARWLLLLRSVRYST